MRSSIFQVLKNLTIYFSKPQSCLYLRMKVIQSHSFKARRSKLCMWPLLIVSQWYEAGLRGLRGHRGQGLTEGLGRFAWHFKMGVGG